MRSGSRRGGGARVHDALGNALVVEMRDLFPQVEVLEKRRTATPALRE